MMTPNENRSPDAAPKADRKGFAPFCPDFAIEVKSPSNGLPELQGEMCPVCQARVALKNVTSVAGSGLLSGFVLELTEVWAGL